MSERAASHDTCWMVGWRAAMDWLAEHKGAEGMGLAEEMGTRLPATGGAE